MPYKDKEKRKQQARKYYLQQKEIPGYLSQKRAQVKKYSDGNPERVMCKAARKRAKRAGIPFNIDETDCKHEGFCPCCGNEMQRAIGLLTDNSPTLDKVVPELGYVKGNVVVVCWRCNRIKSDASIQELSRIADFYQSKQKEPEYEI